MTPIRTLRPLAKVVLSTQSDERLVALSRSGSEDAFAEIVRRHRPGLVRLARSLGVGDRADDVVQDGLVRAWSALQRSEAEIELRPWLTTIVRNRALTSHSTNRVHEELDETIDGVRQPGDIVIMREELRSAVSAVNSLPDSQREALVRSALEGESHDQIASALATSPGAVRQLIFRARTGLREAVGACVPFPLVRALADMGAGGAAVGGSAAGGAAVAAGAGGVGIGLKTVVIVAVGATVAGSGIAIERRATGEDAKAATIATTSTKASGDASEAAPTSDPTAPPHADRSTSSNGRTPEADTEVIAESKSADASRSSTLVTGDSDAGGTPRVADASEGSSDEQDDHPQAAQETSPSESGQAPQQGQQQPPHHGSDDDGYHTTGQSPPPPPPPDDGDGQQKPPPPPPPPPDGDGDGGHQPQPTDAHDGDRYGGLVDLTLGD